MRIKIFAGVEINNFQLHHSRMDGVISAQEFRKAVWENTIPGDTVTISLAQYHHLVNMQVQFEQGGTGFPLVGYEGREIRIKEQTA